LLEPVMHNLAEFILAIFVGRERAVALYGDLLELAHSHGRLWFFGAYARTLAVLSWRIAAAVVAGMVLRQFLVNTLFHFAMRHPASSPNPPILLTFLSDPSPLWYFLPFAAVLYGVHDRFVRLTAIAALGTTAAFLFMAPLLLLCAVTTLLLTASVLIGWWKQAAVLVGAVAFYFVSGMAAGDLSMTLLSHGYIAHYGSGITGLEPMLAFRGSMLLSAYLCARLHGWLIGANECTPAQ
jgi:hypothetical protein